MVQLTAAFFDADDDECTDPLVDVVRRDPVAASRFIKVVMRFGSIGGILVSFVCFAFLAIYWSRCGGCDRPFRWWLVAHSVLQLLQVPVRLVFLVKLKEAESRGSNIEECVSSLTASPAWRTSKMVSFVTYAWFVLGVVWVMNAGSCDTCPGIYRLMLAVILQALARVVMALGCFRALFLQVGPAPEQTSKVEAADPAVIAALPLVTCTKGLFSEPGCSCAVCLCEFEVEEQLRRLPCGHYFHRRCVDQWLKRSGKCPLCMGQVDSEANRKHKHERAQPTERPNTLVWRGQAQ